MHDDSRRERRKQTASRINRVRGQLSGLERLLEEDRPCEDVIVQVRAIQKAVDSLAVHVAGGFLRHQVRDTMQTDPDQALADVARIFELMNR